MYNFKEKLAQQADTQLPGFAMGEESGLLLCSWPRGGKPTLPFVYSDEVWTGIEYQVASHMIFMGMTREGLHIVSACRSRYDGVVRNPFNEYECGYWYARALASYSLLAAYSGIRYDKLTKTLYIKPKIDGDITCFFAFENGFGRAGIKDGKAFYDIAEGDIVIDNVVV